MEDFDVQAAGQADITLDEIEDVLLTVYQKESHQMTEEAML